MADREAQLQQLYDDSGGPGADAFCRLAARKNLKVTDAEARAFVANQSRGQVFQGRLKSDGKVTASREREIYQVDIIDYTTKIGRGTSVHSGGGRRLLKKVVGGPPDLKGPTQRIPKPDAHLLEERLAASDHY